MLITWRLLFLVGYVFYTAFAFSSDKASYSRISDRHSLFLSYARLFYPAMPTALVSLSYQCARDLEVSGCAELVAGVETMLQQQAMICPETITQASEIIAKLHDRKQRIESKDTSCFAKIYAAFHSRLLFTRLCNRNRLSECLRFPLCKKLDHDFLTKDYALRLMIKQGDLAHECPILLAYARELQNEVTDLRKRFCP